MCIITKENYNAFIIHYNAMKMQKKKKLNILKLFKYILNIAKFYENKNDDNVMQ